MVIPFRRNVIKPNYHRSSVEERRIHHTLRRKMGNGMHTWEHTPTFRGFDSFYGFYNGAESYFTHSTAAIPDDDDDIMLPFFYGLDLRNNTEPVADKNGVYSTNLFTEAVSLKQLTNTIETKYPSLSTLPTKQCVIHYKRLKSIVIDVGSLRLPQSDVNFAHC